MKKRFGYLLTAIIILANTLIGIPAHAAYTQDDSFFNSNDIFFYCKPPTADQPPNRCENTVATCAAAGGSITALQGKDNEEKIWNYLTSAGLSGQQAAGVLGNVTTESGGTFSPSVNQFGSAFGADGYGIAQWTGGRRTILVSSLKKSVSDIMSKYYNVNYSTLGGGIGAANSSYTTADDGYIPQNASTGTSIGEADNDTFLLAELKFLVSESKNRSLSSLAVPHIDDGNYQGMTEWQALLKQKSPTSASNLWVYSFEVPADIDTTAQNRAENAAKVYDKYSTAKSGADCAASAVSGSKVAIAKQIIATGNVTCWDEPTNPTCKIIKDVASGANDGNALPCGINMNILKMIAAIAKDHKITINSGNRGCTDDANGGNKTETSRHYAGNGSAIDFGDIDGISPHSVKGANLIISLISPYLVDNSSIGQSQADCLPSSVLTLPSGIKLNRFSDDCTHLHVDVPPDVDPALKCKVPINYGGCENT